MEIKVKVEKGRLLQAVKLLRGYDVVIEDEEDLENALELLALSVDGVYIVNHGLRFETSSVMFSGISIADDHFQFKVRVRHLPIATETFVKRFNKLLDTKES